MRNRKLIESLKPNLEDYLNRHGIDTTKLFRCINPNHDDKTPSMKFFDRDHKTFCHGCRASYDLIDVIGIMENLSFEDALKRAIDLYLKHQGEIIPTVRKVQPKQYVVKDYSKCFYFWKNNLRQNQAAQDYLASRGISEEVARRFNIGFNKFRFGESDFHAAIIPLSRNCYTARNIDPDGTFKHYRPRGTMAEIFNTKALTNEVPFCFITEGEFDALSFETVGGNAISLGGLGHVNKFIDAEKDLDKTYILALDNDARGHETSEALRLFFADNNIKFKEFDNLGEKDANAALVANPNKFKRSVESLISQIMGRAEYEAG